MTDAFIRGLLAGYGIAIPLGAIAILIVITAARESFLQGAAAGLGAASADLIYATVAVAAGAAIGHQLRTITTPLHIAAGCVLVAIALRGLIRAFRPWRAAGRNDGNAHRITYLRFLGLTLINPLTVVYFASVVLGSQTAAAPTGAAAFIAGVAVASASWQTLLAASGAAVGRVLVDRGRVATAFVGYGLVLALALRQFQSA